MRVIGQINACATNEAVIACATSQHISAIATIEHVAAITTDEGVLTAAARDAVGPGSALDEVPCVVADDGVCTLATQDVFKFRNGVAALGSCDRRCTRIGGTASDQVDGHGARDLRVVQGVGTHATDHDVVTARAQHGVVTAAGIDRVSPCAGHNDVARGVTRDHAAACDTANHLNIRVDLDRVGHAGRDGGIGDVVLHQVVGIDLAALDPSAREHQGVLVFAFNNHAAAEATRSLERV